MSRFCRILGWITLICPVLFSGCFQKQSVDSGDEFHMGLFFTDFDPAYNIYLDTSGGEGLTSYLTHSTLFTPRPNQELVPDLALTWEVNAGQTIWTIHLRPDVLFHDGTRMTAEDVRYSFDYTSKTGACFHQPLLSSLSAIEVVDPQTIRFHLKQADRFFVYALMFVHVSKASFDRDPASFRIGTGPFRFIGYDKDKKRLRLDANKNYYGGAPALRSVFYHFAPDETSLLSSLMKGEIDALYLADPSYAASFQNQSLYKIIPGQSEIFYIISLNKMLTDSEGTYVRQALNHLFPSNFVINNENGLKKITSFRPSTASSPFEYDYNPEKAVELFEKAGWKLKKGTLRNREDQPLSLTLSVGSEQEFTKQLVYYFSRELAKLGIEIQVRLRPFSELLKEGFFWSHKDAVLWTVNFRYPMFYAYRYWHSGFNAKNRSPFITDETDHLLDSMRYAPDEHQEESFYNEFENKLAQNPPFIFLLKQPVPVVIHSRFRGYSPKPWEFPLEIKKMWVPKGEQKYQ